MDICRQTHTSLFSKQNLRVQQLKIGEDQRSVVRSARLKTNCIQKIFKFTKKSSYKYIEYKNYKNDRMRLDTLRSLSCMRQFVHTQITYFFQSKVVVHKERRGGWYL